MDFQKLSDTEFHEIAVYIHDLSGINMKESKSTLLSNRLRKRLKEKNFLDFGSYINYVKKSYNQEEIDEMLNVVSTNETFFFRSVTHYDMLMNTIIPDFIDKRKMPVNIWSAGSSSGEEAFTLAILLDEKNLLNDKIVKINGSDLNTGVIKEAMTGIFTKNKLRTTPAKYILNYFTQLDENKYELNKRINKSVDFSRINLKKDIFRLKYDIIMCRNVLIYFDRNDQELIINKFYNALNSGGYLIIGHSESLYFIKNNFKYKSINGVPAYYKE